MWIVCLLVNLLDEWMFVVGGSDLYDDFLNLIFWQAKVIIVEYGDDMFVEWVYCEECYVEKLVILDVSVVDFIGDVDFIKVVSLKLFYFDEWVIYFGLVFCFYCSIFVINELFDLQFCIQVLFFNILQEGDI